MRWKQQRIKKMIAATQAGVNTAVVHQPEEMKDRSIRHVKLKEAAGVRVGLDRLDIFCGS